MALARYLMRLMGSSGIAVVLACSSSPTSPTSGPTPTAPSGPSGSNAVTIQDFTFTPSSITVPMGTTVHWTNNGPSSHTTTSDAGVWDSGSLSPAQGSFQFTFNQAGTFRYHCTNHPPSIYPGFTGTVIVTP